MNRYQYRKIRSIEDLRPTEQLTVIYINNNFSDSKITCIHNTLPVLGAVKMVPFQSRIYKKAKIKK